MALPKVSILIVNYNGLHHLEACFSSLKKQTYPPELIEQILIDNDSHDGSREWMAEHFPNVKIIHNTHNVGFSPAVNQGAKLATGTYLALLNNDTYADPNWISELVDCIEAERPSGVICVGSVMYDWHGRHIDFYQAGINFYGYGDQFFHDAPKGMIPLNREETIIACGGAMLVDREIFIKLGGFDPDFFAYFEDLDFSWRVWLAGYKILVEPRSFVYHRSHGTSSAFRLDQMHALYQRNALATIIKNYSDDSLKQTLPAALMLLIQKSFQEAKDTIPWEQYDLRYRGEHTLSLNVPRSTFSYLAGIRDILENLEFWWTKRAAVQKLRKRSDNEILPLFNRPLGTSDTDENYMYLQQILVDTFGIDQLFNHAKMSRVLVISSDPLSAKISGVGMRSLEMARVLSQHMHVTLAAPDHAEMTLPGVHVVPFTKDNPGFIHRLVADVDIVIASSHILHFYPEFLAIKRVFVIDIYDPIQFENVDYHSRMHATLKDAQHFLSIDIDVVDKQIQAGDFFICASERQRDMWLGWLSAAKRITPAGYVQDPSFRSLIDVVPFGLPDEPPVATERVLKGVIPGIEVDDTVLLWNGGIWDWFDPLTLIQAMSQLQAKRPDVKLFFMGARHPNPMVPNMETYDKAVLLAEELGLRDQSVFFNSSWVPYDERQNYLLEADWAVSTHVDHIETRFSFRTRLLDCLWAGLPMIINSGDILSDYIDSQDLGYVIASGDATLLAETILQAVSESEPRQRRLPSFEQAQQAFAWSNVVKPLIQFCQQPRFAADHKYRHVVQGTQNNQQSIKFSLLQEQLTHLQERSDWLDNVVAAKDEHIQHLENQIKQFEQGRVMQGLRLINKVRGK